MWGFRRSGQKIGVVVVFSGYVGCLQLDRQRRSGEKGLEETGKAPN